MLDTWHSQSASHCTVLHSLAIVIVSDMSAFKSQFDNCYSPSCCQMCPLFQLASCCQMMQLLHCVYFFLSSPIRQCTVIVLLTVQYTVYFLVSLQVTLLLFLLFVTLLVLLSPANVKSC